MYKYLIIGGKHPSSRRVIEDDEDDDDDDGENQYGGDEEMKGVEVKQKKINRINIDVIEDIDGDEDVVEYVNHSVSSTPSPPPPSSSSSSSLSNGNKNNNKITKRKEITNCSLPLSQLFDKKNQSIQSSRTRTSQSGSNNANNNNNSSNRIDVDGTKKNGHSSKLSSSLSQNSKKMKLHSSSSSSSFSSPSSLVDGSKNTKKINGNNENQNSHNDDNESEINDEINDNSDDHNDNISFTPPPPLPPPPPPTPSLTTFFHSSYSPSLHFYHSRSLHSRHMDLVNKQFSLFSPLVFPLPFHHHDDNEIYLNDHLDEFSPSPLPTSSPSSSSIGNVEFDSEGGKLLWGQPGGRVKVLDMMRGIERIERGSSLFSPSHTPLLLADFPSMLSLIDICKFYNGPNNSHSPLIGVANHRTPKVLLYDFYSVEKTTKSSSSSSSSVSPPTPLATIIPSHSLSFSSHSSKPIVDFLFSSTSPSSSPSSSSSSLSSTSPLLLTLSLDGNIQIHDIRIRDHNTISSLPSHHHSPPSSVHSKGEGEIPLSLHWDEDEGNRVIVATNLGYFDTFDCRMFSSVATLSSSSSSSLSRPSFLHSNSIDDCASRCPSLLLPLLNGGIKGKKYHNELSSVKMISNGKGKGQSVLFSTYNGIVGYANLHQHALVILQEKITMNTNKNIMINNNNNNNIHHGNSIGNGIHSTAIRHPLLPNTLIDIPIDDTPPLHHGHEVCPLSSLPYMNGPHMIGIFPSHSSSFGNGKGKGVIAQIAYRNVAKFIHIDSTPFSNIKNDDGHEHDSEDQNHLNNHSFSDYNPHYPISFRTMSTVSLPPTPSFFPLSCATHPKRMWSAIITHGDGNGGGRGKREMMGVRWVRREVDTEMEIEMEEEEENDHQDE